MVALTNIDHPFVFINNCYTLFVKNWYFPFHLSKPDEGKRFFSASVKLVTSLFDAIHVLLPALLLLVPLLVIPRSCLFYNML